MIEIHPSPTADTRTCDFAKVTRDTLLESSRQHIKDVHRGLAFIRTMLWDAAERHDHDKIKAKSSCMKEHENPHWNKK